MTSIEQLFRESLVFPVIHDFDMHQQAVIINRDDASPTEGAGLSDARPDECADLEFGANDVILPGKILPSRAVLSLVGTSAHPIESTALVHSKSSVSRKPTIAQYAAASR